MDTKFLDGIDFNELFEQADAEAQRDHNIATKSNIRRGFESGVDEVQGLLGGAVGLAGDAIGSDTIRDAGFASYESNMKEAALNPIDVARVEDIRSVGDAGKWAMGTVGKLAPSMIEAGVFAAAGGGVAGIVGRTVLKSSLKREVARQLAEGVAKRTAKQLAKKGMRDAGVKAGIVSGVGAMEAGGMWADDAEKYGVDQANPYSAAAFGAISGLSEVISPSGQLITRVMGASKPKGVKDAVEAVRGMKAFLRRAGKEIPKASGKEGMQEVFQEFIGVLNEKVNHPETDMADKEAMSGYLNSFAAGAISGPLFGTVEAAFPEKPVKAQEKDAQFWSNKIRNLEKIPEKARTDRMRFNLEEAKRELADLAGTKVRPTAVDSTGKPLFSGPAYSAEDEAAAQARANQYNQVKNAKKQVYRDQPGAPAQAGSPAISDNEAKLFSFEAGMAAQESNRKVPEPSDNYQVVKGGEELFADIAGSNEELGRATVRDNSIRSFQEGFTGKKQPKPETGEQTPVAEQQPAQPKEDARDRFFAALKAARPTAIDEAAHEAAASPMNDIPEPTTSPEVADATQRQSEEYAPATWDNIKPGQQVTLYRGESDDNNNGGEWWTTDKSKAAKYGKVTSVTLPAETIGKHAAQGHSPDKNEFVFPTVSPVKLAENPASKPEAPTTPATDRTQDSAEYPASPGLAGSKAPLSIKPLSEKSILVVGETFTHKNRLNKNGLRGMWNKIHQGWMFPKKREAEVRAALADLTGETIVAKVAEENIQPTLQDRTAKEKAEAKKVFDRLFKISAEKGFIEGGFETPRVTDKDVEKAIKGTSLDVYSLKTGLFGYAILRDYTGPGPRQYNLTREKDKADEAPSVGKDPVAPVAASGEKDSRAADAPGGSGGVAPVLREKPAIDDEITAISMDALDGMFDAAEGKTETKKVEVRQFRIGDLIEPTPENSYFLKPGIVAHIQADGRIRLADQSRHWSPGDYRLADKEEIDKFDQPRAETVPAPSEKASPAKNEVIAEADKMRDLDLLLVHRQKISMAKGVPFLTKDQQLAFMAEGEGFSDGHFHLREEFVSKELRDRAASVAAKHAGNNIYNMPKGGQNEFYAKLDSDKPLNVALHIDKNVPFVDEDNREKIVLSKSGRVYVAEGEGDGAVILDADKLDFVVGQLVDAGRNIYDIRLVGKDQDRPVIITAGGNPAAAIMPVGTYRTPRRISAIRALLSFSKPPKPARGFGGLGYSETRKKLISYLRRGAEVPTEVLDAHPDIRDKFKNYDPNEKASPSPQSAADIAAKAAKAGAEGVGEAINGLYELFGGASLKSFPGNIDKDTYLKAKPHFEAALDKFRQAGKSLADLVKFLVENFGANIRPYAKAWVSEKQGAWTSEPVDNQAETSDIKEKGDKKNGQQGADRPKQDLPGNPDEVVTVSPEAAAPGNGKGNQDNAGGGGAGLPGDAGLDGRGADGSRSDGGDQADDVPENLDGTGLDGRVAGNYRITSGDIEALYKRGQSRRISDNFGAIGLMKTLQSAGRKATAAEQGKLALYSGWGGLNGIFNTQNESLAGKRRELEKLLTREEFEEARSSSRTAFYTSPVVVDAIYSAVRRLGVRGGRMLEPSMGAGNFVGLMPSSFRSGTTVTGVELDIITGGIAKLLYPNANISAPIGFQDVSLKEGSFDFAIGNPPFSELKVRDKGFTALGINGEPLRQSLHNFFFSKAIHALRPGGISAMVVSNSLMDKGAMDDRIWMARHAELLGAIRLPDTAFLGNTGTTVTTDIVFFQKRQAPLEWDAAAIGANEWVKTTTVPDQNGGEPIPVSQYFAANPHMMLGSMTRQGSMYRADLPTLSPREGGNLADDLAEAIKSLPEGIFTKTTSFIDPSVAIKADSDIPQGTKVNGFFIAKGGAVRMRMPDENGAAVSGPPTRWKAGEKADVVLTAEQQKKVKAAIPVRNALSDLISEESSVAGNSARMDRLRQTLNQKYDAFVAEHSFFHMQGNKSALAADPDYPRLLALEENFDIGITAAVAKKTGEKKRGPSADKAAIFFDRVINPDKEIKKVENGTDALLVSLNESGTVDMARMMELTGKSEEYLVNELGDAIYEDPQDGYVTKDQYLSGNVKAKLSAAKQAAINDPRFRENVEALKKVQPEDIAPEDIRAFMSSPWLTQEVFDSFADHLLDGQVVAKYNDKLGRWFASVSAGNRAKSKEHGTEHMGAETLMEKLITNSSIVIRNWEGKNDIEATMAANSAAGEIRAKFEEWLWNGPGSKERRKTYGRIYNDLYNTHAKRKFDGGHMTFSGMAKSIKLRVHQINAVWRAIQDGMVLLDHVVGAGKSFAFVATAMEMKRMGLVNKPLFVVPNHLIEQWAADFYRLYPGANILAAGKSDFAKGKRQKLFSRIATGNWDAVIVAHSSFKKIGVPAAEHREYIREQIAEYEAAIREAAQDAAPRSIVKQMENKRDKLKDQLKVIAEQQDTVMDFKEMGVDAVFVDEAHEFKNLGFATRKGSTPGLGNTTGSQMATDLFIKARIIQQANKGRGVFLATGTPVSNSLAEMFSMQRFMQYDTLVQRRIASFDAWSDVFAERDTDWELDATGVRYAEKTRFRKFVNMPELMSLYMTFADVVSQKKLVAMAEAMGLRWPIPKMKGGTQQRIVVDRSEIQGAYMEAVILRAENMDPKDRKKDNMLKLTTDATKAALDMRLIDPSAPDEPGSKVNRAVREIFDIYKERDAKKGTQLVFLDMSAPKKAVAKQREAYQKLMDAAERGDIAAMEKLDAFPPGFLDMLKSEFSVYDDMKAKLIKMGVRPDQIAFMHDANTDKQKDDLMEKVRTGHVRILMGSTQLMGAGMNVQNRLVALHHIDAPWRPSDLEQREGRILRQGNMFFNADPDGFEVTINRYATKETYDARRWQIIEGKAVVVESLRDFNEESGREVEDITGEAASAAEMKAAASGDPRIMEQVKLSSEVKKLKAIRKSKNRQRNTIARDAEQYQDLLAPGGLYDQIEESLAIYSKAVVEKQEGHFDIVVGGAGYKSAPFVEISREKYQEGEEGDKQHKKANAEAKKAWDEETRLTREGAVDSIQDIFERFFKNPSSPRKYAFMDIEYRGFGIFGEMSTAVDKTGKPLGASFTIVPDGTTVDSVSTALLYKLSTYYSKTDFDNFSPAGFVQRLNNQIGNIAAMRKNNDANRDIAKIRLEELQAAGGEGFTGEEELAGKEQRLNEITAELAADDSRTKDLDPNRWRLLILEANNRKEEGDNFLSETGRAFILEDLVKVIVKGKTFAAAKDHLHRLGNMVYADGSRKFQDFTRAMKKHLGEAWASFRQHVGKLFMEAKKAYQKSPLGNERGAITIDHDLFPKKPDDTPPKGTKPRKTDIDEQVEEDQQEIATGMIKSKHYDRDSNVILDRWFSTPEHYFKKVEAAGRYMKAVLSKTERKVAVENDILGDVIKKLKALQDSNPAEYRKLAAQLLEADRTGKGWKIEMAEDGTWKLMSPKGKVEKENLEEVDAITEMLDAGEADLVKLGFASETIKVWRSVRESFNRGFDYLAVQMRSLMDEAAANGVDTPKVKISAPKPYAVWDNEAGRVIRWFDTQEDANHYVKIEAVVRPDLINILWNHPHTKLHGPTKALVDASKRVDLVVKKYTPGEDEVEVSLTMALAAMGDLRGTYFPRHRDPGSFALIATKKGEDGIREHFDVHAYNYKDDSKEMAWIKDKANYATPMMRRNRELEAQGYHVTIAKDESVSEDVFEAAKLVMAVDAVMQEATAKDNESDVARELNKTVTNQIAGIFKARGFRSSMIQRDHSSYWKGFEEDPLKAAAQYARGMASGIAKRDVARDMVLAITGRDISWQDFKLINGDDAKWEDYVAMVNKRRLSPTTQKNAYHDVMHHMQHYLRNEEAYDRILGTVKGLAVLKFLGFRVSSAAVNLTNMVMAVPAVMHGIGKIPYADAFKHIARAADDYRKFRTGGELSADDKAIFEEISARGWDEAQFNQEAYQAVRGKFGNAYDSLMRYAMFMFGATEKFNRAATIYGAYKAISEQDNGMSKEDALALAKEVSDKSHGTYGKATLPYFAQGKGPGQTLIRAAYTFQKFSHNYMLTMLDLGFNRRDWKAFSHMLLAPAILSGVGASAAAPLLQGLGLALGFDDPEEDLYKWADEVFGGGEWMRHGVAGLGGRGVNLKGSLQINFAIPTTVNELLGAPASVFLDEYRGMKDVFHGDIMKGAEKMLPTGLGSPIKAAREYREGITTATNMPVFYGDTPVKGDGVDAVIRFFSFNPSSLSSKREEQWNEKEVVDRYSDKRTVIYAEIRRFYLQNPEKQTLTEWAGILADIQAYNEKVRRSGRPDIVMIKPSSIRAAVKKMTRPSRAERAREQ